MSNMLTVTENLKKLTTALSTDGSYRVHYDLEKYLGKPIRLRYTGKIHCCHCGRLTAKSFSQGYCFPCFRSQAQCDSCIVMPEKCHFHKGTCRDESWALAHCMQQHIIYLANTSGIKVGITRATQLPYRWMDQGATQVLPIFQVDSRYQSGLLEVICKAHVADKTNWRTMLSGKGTAVDLLAARDQLLAQIAPQVAALREECGEAAIINLDKAECIPLNYPVLQYPATIKALNLDKNPIVEGVLQGIKGQYLLLDSGVLNIRKFTGYEVVWEFVYTG